MLRYHLLLVHPRSQFGFEYFLGVEWLFPSIDTDAKRISFDVEVA